jgi:hypothetical protein
VLQRDTPSRGRIALFAENGADGQTGSGHDRNLAGEITSFNGTEVAGGNPGTAGGGLGKGSDWDGDDGNPLPQLWDTHVHDVGGLLDATTDKVEISSSDDCVTHVANVIAG